MWVLLAAASLLVSVSAAILVIHRTEAAPPTAIKLPRP
jgi:hypothetical protein